MKRADPVRKLSEIGCSPIRRGKIDENLAKSIIKKLSPQ